MGDQTLDAARAGAALDDASALIRAEAGLTWADDDGELDEVPDLIATLCLKVARRSLRNPDGVTGQSESISDYSLSLQFATADAYITGAERDLIRRAVGVGGLSSVGVEVPWLPEASDDDIEAEL